MPLRGSLLLLIMTRFSSVEYQRSVTSAIGFSLPMTPAAMVCVVRVPSARTPSKSREPSDSVIPLPCMPYGIGKVLPCSISGVGGIGDAAALGDPSLPTRTTSILTSGPPAPSLLRTTTRPGRTSTPSVTGAGGTGGTAAGEVPADGTGGCGGTGGTGRTIPTCGSGIATLRFGYSTYFRFSTASLI